MKNGTITIYSLCYNRILNKCKKHRRDQGDALEKLKIEDLDYTSDTILRILLLSETSNSINIVSSSFSPKVSHLHASLSDKKIEEYWALLPLLPFVRPSLNTLL